MENNIGCNKALWSLVSGASIQTEEGVLGEIVEDKINVFSHEIYFKNFHKKLQN